MEDHSTASCHVSSSVRLPVYNLLYMYVHNITCLLLKNQCTQQFCYLCLVCESSDAKNVGEMENKVYQGDHQ